MSWWNISGFERLHLRQPASVAGSAAKVST
jgi:hypothetical protein